MIRRVVIAGSREYNDYEEAREFIEESVKDIKDDTLIILSGGARGADRLGERYAVENGLVVERHEPNWRVYGRGAGLKRNLAMAASADCVICFWDGSSRGTASMISYAEAHNKPLYVKRIESAP